MKSTSHYVFRDFAGSQKCHIETWRYQPHTHIYIHTYIHLSIYALTTFARPCFPFSPSPPLPAASNLLTSKLSEEENPPLKLHPKYKSPSEQVFLNNNCWIPESCHREAGTCLNKERQDCFLLCLLLVFSRVLQFLQPLYWKYLVPATKQNSQEMMWVTPSVPIYIYIYICIKSCFGRMCWCNAIKVIQAPHMPSVRIHLKKCPQRI